MTFKSNAECHCIRFVSAMLCWSVNTILITSKGTNKNWSEIKMLKLSQSTKADSSYLKSSPLLSCCIPHLQRHLAVVHCYCFYTVVYTCTFRQDKQPHDGFFLKYVQLIGKGTKQSLVSLVFTFNLITSQHFILIRPQQQIFLLWKKLQD